MEVLFLLGAMLTGGEDPVRVPAGWDQGAIQTEASRVEQRPCTCAQ